MLSIFRKEERIRQWKINNPEPDSDGIHGRNYQRGTKTTGLDSEDVNFDLFDSDEDETNSGCYVKQSAFKRLRRNRLTALEIEAIRYVISN